MGNNNERRQRTCQGEERTFIHQMHVGKEATRVLGRESCSWHEGGKVNGRHLRLCLCLRWGGQGSRARLEVEGWGGGQEGETPQ